MPLLGQEIWGNIWKRTVEKNHTNATNVTLHLLICKRPEVTFENTQRRKVEQMQTMWLCFCSRRPFEDTYENARWRKVEQMQTMWLCLFWFKQFENSFENPQLRKVKIATNVTLQFVWCDFRTLKIWIWFDWLIKQARKPRSYASRKLRPTHLPTYWQG